MPFTADHATIGSLDVTTIAPDVWDQVHRPGQHQYLTCRGCTEHMSAAQLKTTRFFRHKRLSPACFIEEGGRGGQEGQDHLAAKAIVRNAIQSLPGWRAEYEVGGHGRRADVLATGPNGEQVVWEIQVSYIHRDTAQARTKAWTDAGTPVAWIDMRNRDQLSGVPRLIADTGRYGTTCRPFERWDRGHWHGVEATIPDAVKWICAGTVTWDGVRWSTDDHRAQARTYAAEQARIAAERRAEATARVQQEEQRLIDAERLEPPFGPDELILTAQRWTVREETKEQRRTQWRWRSMLARHVAIETREAEEARAAAEAAVRMAKAREEEERRYAEHLAQQVARQAEIDRHAELRREQEIQREKVRQAHWLRQVAESEARGVSGDAVIDQRRWRHVVASDPIVSVNDQSIWFVERIERTPAGHIQVDVTRGQGTERGVIDPDEPVDVVIPADELRALNLCRELLGATLMDRSYA